MACSGSHCTNHGTSTTTCGGHRTSCSTNNVLPANIPTTLSGSPVYADDVTALKNYMNIELDRYRQHTSFATLAVIGDTFNRNEAIDSTTWADMATVFFNTTPTPTAGAALDNAFWAALRDKYDIIRQDCICNADCSCNLVCACHNDCVCNYSDARLKQEITYC